MPHVLRLPRRWVFVVPLAVHGPLALLAATAALVVGPKEALDPTSESNRLSREPSTTEAARGEVWFHGAIAQVRSIRSADRSSSAIDPFGGCVVRRQARRSGERDAFEDDGAAWSWGEAVVSSPNRADLTIPLYRIRGGRQVVLSRDEVLRSLPREDDDPSRVRYVRDCYSVGMPISVDGLATPAGEVEPIPGRSIARIETSSERTARVHRRAAWAAASWLALGLPIAWAAAIFGGVRRPLLLRSILSPLAARSARRWPLYLLVGGVLGAFVGLASSFALLSGAIIPLVFTATFAIAGGAFGWLRDAIASLDATEDLLDGRAQGGSSASTGHVDGEANVTGRLRREPCAFAVSELFAFGAEHVSGRRLATLASSPELAASGPDGRFSIDAATARFFGDSRQVSVDAPALLALGFERPGAPRALRFHSVKETTFAPGAAVTVVGRAETIVDRLASNRDYRALGQAKRYAGVEGDEARVLGASREALQGQLDQDRATLRALLAMPALWLLVHLLTLATMARHGG